MWIHRELQVGNHVTDFLAVVKAGATRDVIRDAACDQGILDAAGVGIRAIKDSDVSVIQCIVLPAVNERAYDVRRFGILVDVTRHLRSRPRLPYGLHFQAIALIKVCMRDQLICQHHQCLMRTVVGRKAVNLAIRKCLPKRHHRTARIAPTEPINTLANIPYKKQIPVAPRKSAGDFPLDIGCILRLIHEDMVERHLVLGADTCIFT